MKRLVLSFLISVSGIVAHAGPVRASHNEGPCPVHWAKKGRRGVVEVIRCVAGRVGLSGQKMLRVASCESGLDPRAIGSGLYLGLFQQHRGYWPARAQTYGFDGVSAFNPRANSYVSARMVKASGWGAWPVCGAL